MPEIIMLPSLQAKLKDRSYASHLPRIKKLIDKLRTMGKNALKILDFEDEFILSEMKLSKPPYRLYVIMDQKTDTFYIVDWEHKVNQVKIITELREKLAKSVTFGFDNVFK